MPPPRPRTFRERMLDSRNRRSKNIGDLRGGGMDINFPVHLPRDETSISAHERDVARYRAEDARTGAQVDEVPVTVVVKRKKRGLRNVRIGQ